MRLTYPIDFTFKADSQEWSCEALQAAVDVAPLHDAGSMFIDGDGYEWYCLGYFPSFQNIQNIW